MNVLDLKDLFFEILEKETFLFYLVGVMIIVGVIKEYKLFHLQFLNKFKDKRISAVLFSMFAGVLPVPGRVTVSAGLMDTIATKDKENRKHFGIIDYLATHHFYFWSPLEKTVILPLAALGFTWGHWMLYFIGPLIVYLTFLMFYIFKYVPADAIELDFQDKFDKKEFTLGTLPLFIAIPVAVFVNPSIVFGGLALYYLWYVWEQTWSLKTVYEKALSYINWKLVALLAVVLIVAVIGEEYIENTVHPTAGAILGLMAIIFGATLASGEEDIYAALVAAVVPALGAPYLLALWFSGYFAYSLSPLHKCIWISTGYFGTPIKRYYKVIAMLLGVLAIYLGAWYGLESVGIISL